MMKFLLSPSVTPLQALVSTRHRRWIPALFLIPLVVYVALRAWELRLTELIIPLFPDEADKSFAFYLDFVRLCLNEGLWLSIFFFTAWALVAYGALPTRLGTRAGTRSIVVCAVVVLVGAVAIALFTLDDFPNSADEYVYLYQAETLASGKLTEPAHPLAEHFDFNHIAQKDGIRVGRFPPGWPLLLSVPFLLDTPPLWINPLLGALALLLFYTFGRRFYDRSVAFWSTVLTGLTGYYLFNAASYFSHTACLLLTVGFVFFVHLASDSRSRRHACVAGAFLGAIVVTRYLNAVLIFLPFLLYIIYHHRPGAAFRLLFLMGVGALPFAVALGWYNYSITGDPLLPVTVWADPEERLGFVKGHTVMKAIEYTLRRVFLFLYWASPGVFLLYFIFLVQKVLNKTQRVRHPEDYYLLLLFAGYFFYHHPGGNQYGPRFMFEALPFATVFVVNRVWTSRTRWGAALLAAGALYCLAKMPWLLVRENRVVVERQDLYRKVDAAGLSNAVVLLSTHTGVIRPMPAGDLLRNPEGDEAEVIYAWDLGEQNGALMEYYPDRTFYRYTRPDNETPAGQLQRIR